MSLSIEVYTRELPADIVKKFVKRLNDFDMEVEVHPEFAFDAEKDSGFVPFKFAFSGPSYGELEGKQLLSGFELYMDSFDLARAKEVLRPKLGFWDRLFGKKQPGPPSFAPPVIESRLKDCKIVAYFVWHVGDPFEYRFAALGSAIFTELTNGLCRNSEDLSWFDNDNIVREAFERVCDHEESFSQRMIGYHEFEGW